MDISILKVLAKIGDVGKLAYQGYKSLEDVDVQVRDLDDKLEFLMAWIQVAEERNMIKGDKLVDVWVSQLRRAVWEAEDIVDEYFEVCQSRLEPEPTASRVWPCVPDWRVPDWVPSWALPRWLPCFPLSEVPVRYELSLQIQNVLRQIDEIQKNNMQERVDRLPNSFLAFDRPSMDTLLDRARRRLKEVIGEVIGFDAYIWSTVSLLVEGEGKPGGIVIVTGESGVGKTTVAREVLHVWDVQRHFDVWAWVCLPAKSRLDMYLDQIWEQAQEQTHCGNAAREDMEKVLAEMRLLVVLDGVDGMDELMDLLAELPVGAKGSRILVTTQLPIDIIIQQRQRHDFVSVDIKRLPQDECLYLLTRRLSTQARYIYNKFDKEFGAKIYEISGGLPLAIILLAGLIYFKDHGSQVREVFNILEACEHKRLIKRILIVSYATMPTILKLCFLHFAAMPPNVHVEVKKLIALWYADGIPEPGVRSSRPQMHLYVDALVSRGLVQRVGDDGICIHQSVHGFAKDMACKIGFMEHHSKFDIRAASTVRGISVQNYIDRYMRMDNRFPKLRTFVGDFAEDSVAHPSGSYVASSSQGLKPHQISCRLQFLCQSKFIRAVDLQGLMLGRLPDNIGDMIHLRYLGLRRCCLKDLPPSVAKLMNLETLDITGNEIQTIVDEFWKIGSLKSVLAQNLSLPMSALYMGLPTGLQTLHGVILLLSPLWTEDDCPLMPWLLSFQVAGTTVANAGAFAMVLGKMPWLKHLKIAGDCIPPPIISFSNLRSLELDGKVLEDEVATESHFFPNATKILLRSSCLSEKSLHSFLPTYLSELELLDNSFTGSKLLLEGFDRLDKIKLGNLKLLEELVVGESLQTLEIFGCPNMKKIQGLKNAKYLQNVILHDMAATQVGAEDKQLSDKIKHVRTAAWARTTSGGGRPTRDTSPNRRQLAKD